MKKLLLLATLLIGAVAFAEDGPNFPYSLDQITSDSNYEENTMHPICDKARGNGRAERDLTRNFGPRWYVHNRVPFYGPYASGNYWYPHNRYYGPSPAGAVVGAVIAGSVIGAAATTCCCW